MKFSELLEHAQTCIKTFNPVIMSLDSHADEYIAAVSQHPLLHKPILKPDFIYIVQRSLRKGICEASLLWLHTLLRIPQGKQLTPTSYNEILILLHIL